MQILRLIHTFVVGACLKQVLISLNQDNKSSKDVPKDSEDEKKKSEEAQRKKKERAERQKEKERKM